MSACVRKGMRVARVAAKKQKIIFRPQTPPTTPSLQIVNFFGPFHFLRFSAQSGPQ